MMTTAAQYSGGNNSNFNKGSWVYWMKSSKGTNQRTLVLEPWAQARISGLTEGGKGWVEVRKGEKVGKTVTA